MQRHVLLRLCWAATLVLVSACGRSQATSTGSGQSSAGQVAAWSLKSDCAKCHADHIAAAQDGTTSAGAAPHEAACTDCHKDETELTKAHANATKAPDTKIEGVNVSKEVCLGCHGSYVALADKTKGSTALTDSNGLSVNPHAIPLNETHESDPECINCHSVHGQKDPKQYCFGCHHKEVFECGTCHE